MRRHLPAIALALVAVVLLVGALTQRSDPDLLRFEVEGTRAYGYGYTDGRSAGVVDALLREHPEVDTLVLVNMPGTADLVANQRLARRIRARGLDTELRPDSFIASGAVSLFIAGVERRAACGSRVGVHAWSVAQLDAREALWDNFAGYMEDFLADMGLDPAFYAFTREAAPGDGLHIMSPQELERWGLVTEPMGCS